jgi:putative (di)nucleoside polyphosphate hydrolase
MAADQIELPYRPCVGIMLMNRDGSVWLGRRPSRWAGPAMPNIWQMPQGGICAGEDERAAALRELEEETGARSVEVLAKTPNWYTYDLPHELLGVALRGKYRGQRQRWFAMRFLGTDDEIDLQPKAGRKAEFDAWRWASIAEIPHLIVPFKRRIYEDVVSTFAHLAA